jgi:hypothetical protein
MRAVERRYKINIWTVRNTPSSESVINITENLFCLRRKIRFASWRRRMRGREGREDDDGDIIGRDASIADDSERVPDSHIAPPENRTRYTRTFDCGA